MACGDRCGGAFFHCTSVLWRCIMQAFASVLSRQALVRVTFFERRSGWAHAGQDCKRDLPSVLVLGGALGPALRLRQGRGAHPWCGVHASSLALPANSLWGGLPVAGGTPSSRGSPRLRRYS